MCRSESREWVAVDPNESLPDNFEPMRARNELPEQIGRGGLSSFAAPSIPAEVDEANVVKI